MPARITGWPQAGKGLVYAPNGVAEISLSTPQFGIAAGQAAALYDAEDPDRLLGGGWITAAPTAASDAG